MRMCCAASARSPSEPTDPTAVGPFDTAALRNALGSPVSKATPFERATLAQTRLAPADALPPFERATERPPHHHSKDRFACVYAPRGESAWASVGFDDNSIFTFVWVLNRARAARKRPGPPLRLSPPPLCLVDRADGADRADRADRAAR